MQSLHPILTNPLAQSHPPCPKADKPFSNTISKDARGMSETTTSPESAAAILQFKIEMPVFWLWSHPSLPWAVKTFFWLSFGLVRISCSLGRQRRRCQIRSQWCRKRCSHGGIDGRNALRGCLGSQQSCNCRMLRGRHCSLGPLLGVCLALPCSLWLYIWLKICLLSQQVVT